MTNVYNISTIATLVNGVLEGASLPTVIEVILIDSRKMVAPNNALFFAIVGNQHNGHQYINALVKRGFRNFVVEQKQELPSNCCQIIVPDTLIALQKLAKEHRKQYNYPVVGITGSNGKTVVKEWLFQLLQRDIKVVRSPKSYNSQIGVPLSIWKMKKSHQIALIEAGISKQKEMSCLQEIIAPTDVIVTNILEAHDENFATRPTKAREKLFLAKSANRVFFCADYKDINEALKQQKTAKKITWSTTNSASNLWVKKTEKHNKHTSIDAIYNASFISITIPFNDNASVENAIHCWLFLLEKGYNNTVIAERMLELTPVTMRLELKTGINGNTIINDSYNSDVASLGIALDLLNQQQQHKKKVLILSDIYQSGKEQHSLYIEVAKLIQTKKIDKIIGVGRFITEHKNCFSALDAHFFDSTDKILNELTSFKFDNCAILIKGSRSFRFELISKALEYKNHETVLEINLSAIQNNLNYYRFLLSPSTKVMAMVKAFSYGSGTYEIANVMQFNNVDYLGVAYADEGIALRKAGITLPIMVMNPERGAFHSMIKYQLEPEIFNLNLLIDFITNLRSSLQFDGNEYPIHIKLDTGMNRLGFKECELDDLLQVITKNTNVKIQSVFSHLVGSGDKKWDDFTKKQFKVFDKLANKIEETVPYVFDKHILNSAGVERFNDAQYNMVRLGIGIHGVAATSKVQKKLEQVAVLKTSISQIKTVKKGESVGYNRSGIADKELQVATIAIGYADGFSRRLGNGKGKMVVQGKLAPVIGDVCMDMCMLDVTEIDCKVGDSALVFGDSNYTLLQLANDLDTIPYEVLTSISQRVKRVYFWE